jgi:hypothetical protein
LLARHGSTADLFVVKNRVKTCPCGFSTIHGGISTIHGGFSTIHGGISTIRGGNSTIRGGNSTMRSEMTLPKTNRFGLFSVRASKDFFGGDNLQVATYRLSHQGYHMVATCLF